MGSPAEISHSWPDRPHAHDAHVDFTDRKANGQHQRVLCRAEYVRCRRCGQIGFRKPGRKVVYTWAQNDC